MDKIRSNVQEYFNHWYYKVTVLFTVIVAVVYRIWWFAALEAAALIIMFASGFVSDKLGIRKMRIYFNKILSSSTTDAANFPFAAAVLNAKGKITWYNKELDRIFGGELLFQKDIASICKGFDINRVVEQGSSKPFRALMGGGSYDIWAHKAMSGENEGGTSVFAYFIDVSEHEEQAKKYIEEQMVVAHATFDNYDEVMQNVDDESKTRLNAEVDRTVAAFGAEMNAVFKKLERGRYFLVMNKKNLDALTAKRFEVLASIREISANVSSSMNPTISIGIGSGGSSLAECDAFARAALDMALGRGGDQAVIKDAEKFRFYGGKTKEFEKSARVKARVIAQALHELICQSDKVIVMSHKNADIDAAGSAVGIMAAARSKGKKAYMVLTNHDKAVSKIIGKLKELPEYQNAFIRSDEAKEKQGQNTLLVVLDTHSVSYVSNPELLENSEQTVVIDHHRRSADFIENPVLLYHEPYASSACEMVTEMLQYMGGNIKLTKTEAEAIYAGIYLDTKGFTFKTGVRTLEAAAYLRRTGVDTIAVKQLFQTDIDEMQLRYEIISSAEIFMGNIAISYTGKKSNHGLIARAADELLTITGITTSFVLAPEGRGCIISGRSMGDINVQMVLEKLGGGGHLSVAGAQLENRSVTEGMGLLKEALEEYFKEQ